MEDTLTYFMVCPNTAEANLAAPTGLVLSEAKAVGARA